MGKKEQVPALAIFVQGSLHLQRLSIDVPERGRLIEGAGLRLAPEEVVDLVGEARDLLDDLVQDL